MVPQEPFSFQGEQLKFIVSSQLAIFEARQSHKHWSSSSKVVGITHGRVHICTSGGAASACPGLFGAIAEAYRCMRAAQEGQAPALMPSRIDLEREVAAWRDPFSEWTYNFAADWIEYKGT